jgi:flagellar hook-length control protein FliK
MASGISQLNNTLLKETKQMENSLTEAANESANQSLESLATSSLQNSSLQNSPLAEVLQPEKQSNSGLVNQAKAQAQQHSSLESVLPSESPVTITTVTDNNTNNNNVSVANTTTAHTSTNSIGLKTAGEPQNAMNQADNQDAKEQSEKQNQQTLFKEVKEIKEQQNSIASQLQGHKENTFSATDTDNQVVQNALDKTLDKAVSHLVGDNSRVKSLTAEQEFAINQLLTKTSVDNIASQSVNNETKLSQEIMSVYRKDFTHSVKEKVMVMINQKINQLEIRLDPAELGSMHVKVNLQNEQAVVSFVVQNSQTKDVLEQNIGKLKEMLADSGIDVGESNIEQQDNSADESAEFAQQQQTNEHEQQALTSEESGQMATNLYKASSTGIDYFA